MRKIKSRLDYFGGSNFLSRPNSESNKDEATWDKFTSHILIKEAQ